MILPISYGSGAGLPGDKNVERSVSGDIHVGLDREATRKISGSGVERTAAGRRPTDRNVRIRFWHDASVPIGARARPYARRSDNCRKSDCRCC